jgi:hypothetical protein
MPQLQSPPPPAPAPQEAPVTIQPVAPPQSSGNPLLVGNDALRQQFADHPDLAPQNDPQWLDEREQHILGNDAPPVINVSAPPPSAPSPPPMLPQAPESPAPPPLSAPQQPPMLPSAPQGLPAAPQAMSAPPPSAPMLQQPPAPPVLPTLAPAQITQLPQQAPVTSQVSPAPAVAAKANIDNNVAGPAPTFTPAYQPPPLPTLLNPSLIQNHPYSAAPSMPGYAMPRPGHSFMQSHPAAGAPQLPTFDNPFMSPGLGAGGFTAGVPSQGVGIAQQPYDNSLFASFMMPRNMPQY